jgi:ABC-2 type transport system ATP-binding protein
MDYGMQGNIMVKPDSFIAIQASQLTKHYKDVLAVDDISFEIQNGELFGFLGPNGAGKTTTINMLTGLARADSGKIHINGIDCTSNLKAAQDSIGVVPDESNLYPELSGMENLCFCAALYGIRGNERKARASELLNTFSLSDVANRKFAAYSKGMKRKLTIAAGIVHRPSVLFLDEPTTGIDVASARQVRQLITDLHKAGTTIFLTTHYIEEAERLCERIAFIVNGRIVRIDSTVNLLQSFHTKEVLLLTVSAFPQSTIEDIASMFPEYQFTANTREQIRVESERPVNIGPLIRFLEERNIDVVEARKLNPSIEDVFVRLTKIDAGIMRKEKEKSGGGQ